MPFAFDGPEQRAWALAVLLAAMAWAGFAAPAAARPRHHRLHHPRRLRHVAARPEIGRASYYGVHSAGRTTASGRPLAPNKLTAASPVLPLGTKARVVNLKNGRAVDVTVTDRGPFVAHRILDVSPKAARRLRMRKAGVTTVKVKPLAVPAHSEGAPRLP